MKTWPTVGMMALVLAGCSRPGGDQAAVPPVPVEVATVETRSVPVEMKSIGTVEPIASVQVKAKVAGEILSVHFSDGAPVATGDLLFRVDPRTYEAVLRRANANLAIAQSTAGNASEQAERYTTLIKRGVASKEQFSQYLATAESQKSGIDARQADVEEAALSLEWTQIKAPISGRAGAALLKAGNIVQANTDVLTVINQIKPIYVSFSLPESSLAEVRRRLSAGSPSVTARNPDTGEVLATGVLTFIDNAVDRASGMITFKATFPNDNEALWPGQFVDVTVKVAEEPGALVIPSTAVMEGQHGPQVFVVEKDVAKLRKIRVDRTAGDLSIIGDGLSAGERVVENGQLRVGDGARVEDKAPGASP